jgi:hypothetical protein
MSPPGTERSRDRDEQGLHRENQVVCSVGGHLAGSINAHRTGRYVCNRKVGKGAEIRVAMEFVAERLDLEFRNFPAEDLAPVGEAVARTQVLGRELNTRDRLLPRKDRARESNRRGTLLPSSPGPSQSVTPAAACA